MSATREATYYSFDATRQKCKKFDIAIRALESVLLMIKTNPRLFIFDQPQRRSDTQFMEYQQPERKAKRRADDDRVFPLDTIKKEDYSTKTDTRLDNVMIHTGPFADEYARSFNALAVTLANEIFFRNGAYAPESEEGRKTLAHELTHVGQYTEKRITKNITEEELEKEAEQAEKYEAYNSDPEVTINLNGKYFTFRESEKQLFAEEISENIVRWAKEENGKLIGKKRLNFLCGLNDWLEGRGI